MLADPIVIGSNQYAKIADGVYRATTSSTDQPQDLIIKNQLNPDGISSFLFQYKWSKNSTTAGAKDDVGIAQFQLRFPGKVFTPTDMLGAKNELVTFMAITGYWDRLVKLGER